MTEEELEKLKEAALKFESMTENGNLVRLAEADVEFHEVIYQSSDNRRLNQVLNNLREQIYRYRVEYLKDEATRKTLVKEHEEIYEAIRAPGCEESPGDRLPPYREPEGSDHALHQRGNGFPKKNPLSGKNIKHK